MYIEEIEPTREIGDRAFPAAGTAPAETCGPRSFFTLARGSWEPGVDARVVMRVCFVRLSVELKDDRRRGRYTDDFGHFWHGERKLASDCHGNRPISLHGRS